MSRVVSFKLRPFDEHVWVVRQGEAHGRTLRGESARRAFALGASLFAIASPEAPQRVRALSVDCRSWRLLATLEEEGAKPRAVRVDGETVRAATGAELLAFLVA